MRLTFDKAVEIIEHHYGKKNVVQIRSHNGKYIVDEKDGTYILSRGDILNLRHI